MSEMQQPPPSSLQPSSGMSITEVWLTAVTQPNEEAYGRIANDPNASLGKAIGFAVGASVLVSFVSVVIQTLVMMVSSLMNGNNEAISSAFGSLIGAACSAPIGAAIGAMVFLGINGLAHLIATALGGKGSYERLVWTVSAYSVPLTVMSVLLSIPSGMSAIPGLSMIVGGCLCILGVPLLLYHLYLNVLSIKVVHELEWTQAAIASLAIWIGILCLCAIVFACMMVILGPVIGNVFSEINGQLVP